MRTLLIMAYSSTIEPYAIFHTPSNLAARKDHERFRQDITHAIEHQESFLGVRWRYATSPDSRHVSRLDVSEVWAVILYHADM